MNKILVSSKPLVSIGDGLKPEKVLIKIGSTPAGAQGLQGIQGEQGIQGIQGVSGNDGATGIQGDTGIQGLKGDTGATGAQGIQGVKGDTGEQGIKGDTGLQGIQGDPVPITTVLGQSITEAVSQKLLTDEVTSTNNRVVTLESVSGKVKNKLDNVILDMWVGTQAQLDAVVVKDVNTIYMVKA